MKLGKIFIMLLVLSTMFLLVACDDKQEPPHEHTYATEWSKDDEKHWHDSTCGHNLHVKDKALHTWGEGVITLEPTESSAGKKVYTCTVCGQTKEEIIASLPHDHTFETDWSSDKDFHWHASDCNHDDVVKDKSEHSWDKGKVTTTATCATDGIKIYTCIICGQTKSENLGKSSNHIEGEEQEITYIAGYKVTSYKECGQEISKEVCFTYSHTFNDGTNTVTHILPVELNEDGIYTFEFSTVKWGRFVMNIGETNISSAESVMVNSDGWAGGGYAGTYPLYHDGDTVTFLSATGGSYNISYNPETKELLIGNYVEPVPLNGFMVYGLNSESQLSVWNESGFEVKSIDGKYVTANGWRLFIVVDAEGKIAYMAKSMVNGYGGAMSDTYIRHSDYINHESNPAFIELGDIYQNQWGDTRDWSLGVPEGGFVITAHSEAQSQLIERLLGLTIENQEDSIVNTNAHNVDDIQILFDAEHNWILINEIILEHEHTADIEWLYDDTDHWHGCSGCEEAVEFDKAAHEYEDEVTVEPAIGVAGEKTFTCACGHFYTEEVPALVNPVMTIAEALAGEEGQSVIIIGTVIGIYQDYNSTYNNISVYITDETGTILSFRLVGNVELHSIIKVTGNLTEYNGKMQIAEKAIFELLGIEECDEFTEATCKDPASCILCGEHKDEITLPHSFADGLCTVCGEIDPDYDGDVSDIITISKTITSLITQYGWTDSTTKQAFKLDDNVNVKINGGSNSGKAYDGNHIRVYASDNPAGSITISVPEGYELVTVKITCQTGTYAFLNIEGISGDVSNKTITVSGNNVVIKTVLNGNSGKQVRISGIEVVYKLIES